MSVVKRGILLFSVLIAVVSIARIFSIQPTKQTIPTVTSPISADEAKHIELPASVIRGDYRGVFLRQEIARALFVEQVESQQNLLVNIRANVTDDGFVVSLEPIFAPVTLKAYQKEHVAVFFTGEEFIEDCFPAKIDVCMRTVAGREYQVKRVFTNMRKNAETNPRVVVIVYGSREIPI